MVTPDKRTLLLISDSPADEMFCRALAGSLGYSFAAETTRDGVRRVISASVPAGRTLVFWDAESLGRYEAISDVLPKYVKPRNVFAITDNPLPYYPDLFKYQIFDQHLVRAYMPPSEAIVRHLAKATEANDTTGLERYFDQKPQIKRVPIRRSAHKIAAIEALHNYLGQQKIPGRLATVVAQALDELVMNAVFDAPIDVEGNRYRHQMDRVADFELQESEQVFVEIASDDRYMAIAVTDPFGSLRRSTLLESVGRHYRRTHVGEGQDMDSGVGFRGILESGLSLIVSVRPRVKTQIVLLFPKAATFREFKEGFRFFSAFVE